MALYDGDTNTPASYLVEPESVDTTVSEIIASAGIAQWAGAETQKFGHITLFWNGNRSSKFNQQLETYVEIPSDLVPFNERPWMKSAETADAAIEAVRSGEFGFIRMNFAGGDMVGHTADIAATRIAVESVDLAIGRIADAVAAGRDAARSPRITATPTTRSSATARASRCWAATANPNCARHTHSTR